MAKKSTRVRTTKPSEPWSLLRCSQIAQEVFAAPPKLERIERHVAPGPLVWSAIVPAALCIGVDRLGAEKWWAREKRRSGLLKWMMVQHGLRKRDVPLEGRPVVHCIRLTSSEPDTGSAWEKLPVDCLVKSWVRGKKSHKGLGLLHDDKPACVDLRAWWEPGVRGMGCVVIRVFADPKVTP
jgi:hypothetical protein